MSTSAVINDYYHALQTRATFIHEILSKGKVERMEGESAFHREGPIEAKNRDWAKAVLLCWTKRGQVI